LEGFLHEFAQLILLFTLELLELDLILTQYSEPIDETWIAQHCLRIVFALDSAVIIGIDLFEYVLD